MCAFIYNNYLDLATTDLSNLCLNSSGDGELAPFQKLTIKKQLFLLKFNVH